MIESAQEIRDLFTEAGLRCTKQRIELYRALATTKAHPTAEQLREMLGCDCSCSSLATVYNTLETFCKAGIIRCIPTASGPTRYDADTTEHLHVKAADGTILDVPHHLGEKLLAAFPSDLVQQIADELGIPIERVNLELIAGHAADPAQN